MKLKPMGAAILVGAQLSAALVAGEIAERKTLTLEGAQRAIAAAVSQAHKNRAGGVIAVVDDGGNVRRGSKYIDRQGAHRGPLPETDAGI